MIQGLVLQFYGFDSLDPTEWQDRKRETIIGSVPTSGKSALRGEATNERILAGLTSLDTARQLLREECDPLDIKDANYMRQLQLVKSTPKTQQLSSVTGIEGESMTSLETVASEASGGPHGSIIITQTNFNAHVFLKDVHGDTSYADLVRGRENLQWASQQRNESLKNLVKQNFDRFVNAKNATERVFRDMQQRRLSEPDHGMRRAMEAIAIAYQKTQDVFGHLMVRRDQEVTIRQKLEVFDRYDFIFSLGLRLERSMKIGEYQSAVSDYRKAKSILAESAANKTLQIILQRIWSGHIERILNVLRKDLFAKLTSPIFPYDVHSKLIDFLIDLDAHPDPIVTYFNTRKDGFFDQCRAAAERTLGELSRITPDADGTMVTRILLNLVQTRQFHKVSHLKSDVVHCWKIRSSFVLNLVDLFRHFFFDFSKFVNSLLSGRFNCNVLPDDNSGAGNKQRVDDFAAEFAANFPKLFDLVVLYDLNDRINVKDSSLVASHYAVKHVNDLFKVLAIVWDSKSPDFVVETIQATIVKCAASLLSAIWTNAKHDCAALPYYETWQWSGEGFDFSTILVKNFETLLISLLNSSAKIIEAFDEIAEKKSELCEGLDMKLTDVVCAFLESLLALAVKVQRKSAPEEIISTVDIVHDQIGLDNLGVSYRMLTIITNIIYLRETAVPHILEAFTMGSLGERAKNTIAVKLDSVDSKIRQAFLDNKRSRLMSLIQTGTINSGFDWQGDRTPSEIRPYCLAVLLELVTIQTQIYDVSSKILRSLMSELVLDIFQEFLRCFQMIRQFFIGGYLQARAEVAILQHKLITVMSEDALAVFASINSTLDSACRDPPSSGETKRIVDQLVSQADDITQMAFVCFQYT